MLLDEESSPNAVIDELQHLLAKLHVHEEELARINKYQALFKVGSFVHVMAAALPQCMQGSRCKLRTTPGDGRLG